MSEKKSLQSNLSHKNIDDIFINLVNQLTSAIKKIKSGYLSKQEFKLCDDLCQRLQNLLNTRSDIDDIDRWIAKETIEMCENTRKDMIVRQ